VKGKALFAFIVSALILIFLLNLTASAQEKQDVYKTACCIIRYPDDEYLKTFTHRIGGFKFTSKGLDDRLSLVKPRVDNIMEKVQAALDMYPSDMRISILLYPDYKSLKKIFRQFTLTETTPLAFYSHRTKSIYIDVSSITDGVLAHEMAHAVINFYFKTPPPAKMQEILAQYVDLHLWD